MQKKINCQFYAGASKQLKPYIEIKQMEEGEGEDERVISVEQAGRKKEVEEFKQAHSRSEIHLLKKLIEVPKQLDPQYMDKMCSYRIMLGQE